MSLALVGTVGAQPQPASAPGDIGFVGIPESTSAETGIPFFDGANAQLADKATADMRNAAAKCDKKAYDAALDDLNHRINLLVGLNSNDRLPSTGRPPADPLRMARRSRDIASLREVFEKRPQFPANCTPPGTAYNPGAFNLFLIGGGMVPLSGSGNITGVDTFFGPGNFLIDNRTNGASSNATALAGARLRLYWLDLKRGKWEFLSNTSFFIESGIQTGFGAQSFIQSFGGVSATPQGFGSDTVKENFQIPVLIGAGFPLTSPGPGQTPVFLDFYGGATISNWTQTLQGREAGAPAGSGFFSAQTRTTVDPTIAAGVRIAVGDFNGDGIADIIVGANVELSFRPGSVVQAQSSSFPSESYIGSIDPRPNAAFMVRVGIPFGGTH